MKTKYFVDPLNKGFSHVYINAALVKSMDGQKTFIGNTSHIEKVKELYTEGFFIAIEDTSFTWGIIKKIILLIKKGMFRKIDIVFLCFDNTIIPILLILCYPFLLRSKVSLIVHNNLTTLSRNRIKRLLHNNLVKMYKANVYVLTREMKRIYKTNINAYKNCIYIPHPNYKGLVKAKKNRDILIPSKLNIVLLGRQAGLLIDYLSKIDLRRYSNIHFTVVSSAALNWLEKRENITQIKEKLPFGAYYGLLREADFCLFASDESVRNRASGILMDSITMKCPIIAPKFGHFLEYEKFDLGYLYEDLNDLEVIFERISNEKIKRSCFEPNFDGALSYSSVENIKVDLNS